MNSIRLGWEKKKGGLGFVRRPGASIPSLESGSGVPFVSSRKARRRARRYPLSPGDHAHGLGRGEKDITADVLVFSHTAPFLQAVQRKRAAALRLDDGCVSLFASVMATRIRAALSQNNHPLGQVLPYSIDIFFVPFF